VLLRAELSRVLLDLTDARPSVRLAAVRAAIPRAVSLSRALSPDEAPPTAGRTRPRSAAAGLSRSAVEDDPDDPTGDDPTEGRARPIPAAERRRAAEVLLGSWMDTARDLALVGSGGGRSVRDPVLLDELAAVSAALPPGSAARFLQRAARSAELLASNVSPELILDALALAWPRRTAGA
jgi:hypothetical protein